MNKENIITKITTINKDDSILSKIAKWAVWFTFIYISILFGCLWLVFFILFAIPVLIIKGAIIYHKHKEYKKSAKIVKQAIKDEVDY